MQGVCDRATMHKHVLPSDAALRARLSGESRLECAMRRVPAAYDRTRLSEELRGGVGPDWLHEMALLDDGGEAEIWSGPGATLAASLIDRPLAVIGPTELSPALNRFKNQMNENAARFVRTATIPEMNHNESVAWGGVGDDGDASADEQGLLLLTWNGMHPRVQQRLDWMVAHATTETAWNLVGEGESLLECLLYHCLVMDWLSTTLALLHGKDPSAIAPIRALKAHLDSVQ